jgi:hypothetical protein
LFSATLQEGCDRGGFEPLFAAQCHHGIDLRRAPRRDVASHHRDFSDE